jgi:NADH dehydrogenase FAD-containing subunit
MLLMTMADGTPCIQVVLCCGSCLQALQALGVDIMTGWKVTAVESAAEAAAAAVAAEPAAVAESLVADQDSGISPASSSSSAYGIPQQPVSPVSPAAAAYTVQLEPSGPYGSSTVLPADLVLWTAGSKPASQSLQPFPVDTRGQLQTDATLRVLQHSRVFALGDVSKGQNVDDGSSASAGGGQGAVYPATAQVAFQQADYAAWNIWSAINGRPLLPFRYVKQNHSLSLGSSQAARHADGIHEMLCVGGGVPVVNISRTAAVLCRLLHDAQHVAPAARDTGRLHSQSSCLLGPLSLSKPSFVLWSHHHPCRYQHLGDMMSLGATNAAVALPFQLPSELTASITASPLGPLLSLAGLKLGSGQQQSSAAVGSGDGVTLEGPLAQLLRRAAYLYRQPTNEQRINVAASWMQQAADAAARLAAEASANSSSSGVRR